jgi:hypothetical protein
MTLTPSNSDLLFGCRHGGSQTSGGSGGACGSGTALGYPHDGSHLGSASFPFGFGGTGCGASLSGTGGWPNGGHGVGGNGNGGGGGGGWHGGGAGGNSPSNSGGGGGGSSYPKADLSNAHAYVTSVSHLTTTGAAPPSNNDPDYGAGIANGASGGHGGNGRVVLYFDGVLNGIYDYSSDAKQLVTIP